MKAADDDDLEGLLLVFPRHRTAAGHAATAGANAQARCERIWTLACLIEPDTARVMDWWQHDALAALDGLTAEEALAMGKGDQLEQYLMDILEDG